MRTINKKRLKVIHGHYLRSAPAREHRNDVEWWTKMVAMITIRLGQCPNPLTLGLLWRFVEIWKIRSKDPRKIRKYLGVPVDYATSIAKDGIWVK